MLRALHMFFLANTYGKAYDIDMTSLTATKARSTLYELIASLQDGQDPVLITGKHGNAVMIAEEDWRSIEETLYLMSIPSMRESIRSGMCEPVSKCRTTIDL